MHQGITLALSLKRTIERSRGMSYVMTADIVGKEFAEAVLKHYLQSEVPLLQYLHPNYQHTLIAESGGLGSGDMVLIDPRVDPRCVPTWRQWAKQRRQTLEEMANDLDVEIKPEEIDEPADTDLLIDYGGENIWPTPLGSAFRLLEPWLRGKRRSSLDSELEKEPLGYVSAYDGPCPGSDYLGVHVSSLAALTCLQRVLDIQNSGIKIVVRRRSS
jgi:hypothetical protein